MTVDKGFSVGYTLTCPEENPVGGVGRGTWSDAMPRKGTVTTIGLDDDVFELLRLLANSRNTTMSDVIAGWVLGDARAMVDSAKAAGVFGEADEAESMRAYFRAAREEQASAVEAVLAGGAKPRRPRSGTWVKGDAAPGMLRRCVLAILQRRPDFGLPTGDVNE